MKKILYFEDNKEDLELMKVHLENNQIITLPDSEDDKVLMANAIDKAFRNISITEFAIQQINKNYKDIGLIICDISLGQGDRLGMDVVRAIRNYKELNPSYWTSMVPIIGLTAYNSLKLQIIEAGADFVATKPAKDEYQWKILTAIIDTQIDTFMKRLEVMKTISYPTKIIDGIIKLKKDYKNEKTAFIISSFSENHNSILTKIKNVLKNKKITGLLSRDKEYVTTLWDNVQIYMHGCDFGIVVLSNIDIDKPVNQNVLLEMGYMLGVKKPVLVLKEKQLQKVFTDVQGEYWHEFDAYNLDSIKTIIEKFIKDNNLCQNTTRVRLKKS